MRAIVSAILLCVLLEACGSKGALVVPPPPGSEQQPPKSNKQD
jgi:predicted small lipoprotein YifL